MRVKVGDTWYEATEDAPIMVELTDADKANIANMIANANRYAAFVYGSPMSVEEKVAWMAGDRLGVTGNPATGKCSVPPEGWECSREPGHSGPCAAKEVELRKLLPHEYVPSALGHGEGVCVWCKGTNRENAVIEPNGCKKRTLQANAIHNEDFVETTAKHVVAALLKTARPFIDAMDNIEEKAHDSDSLWESPAAMALDVRDIRALYNVIKAAQSVT